MNYLQMRKKAAELLAKARELQTALTAEAETLSDEDLEAKTSEIEALISQAQTLRARADRLEAIESAIDDGDDDDDLTANVVDIDDPSANDGGARRIPAQARDRAAEARCGFNDLGEFAASVFCANPQAAGPAHFRDPRLTSLYNDDIGDPRAVQRAGMSAAATGLSMGIGPEGGWLVPPAFSTQIWDGMAAEEDNLLSRCSQFPIDSESITLLANAETSRVTGSRYGGVQGYWLAEAAQMTASKPKLRKVKLEPHELAVLVYVTDKLLNAGGAAVTNWLQKAATSELNWLIGDAIINGNGAGKPKGILNSGSLISVAKSTGQAADTFNQENIAAMHGRMHARSRRSAIWLMNQDVDPQLDLMVSLVKNVAGSENVGGFQASLYNRDRDTIKNRPIVRTEWNKTVGDVGDVILADMEAYACAFRRSGVSSAASMHLRFDYNETAFRFIMEIDGQPFTESPLTPANGTNTLSPFVTVAARA